MAAFGERRKAWFSRLAFPTIMGSEDFGYLALDGHKMPAVIFWLGAMDPAKLAARATASEIGWGALVRR
jgi:hypothetical protein